MIVDTGPGISGSGGSNVFSVDEPAVPGNNTSQSVLGLFSLDDGAIITSVQGWMSTSISGTLTAAIYENDGGLPGLALYKQSFAVESLYLPSGNGIAAGWFGTSDSDWMLNSGSYWLSFEVLPSDSLYGIGTSGGGVTMTGDPNDMLNPLDSYLAATGNPNENGGELEYVYPGDAAYGMRIEGTLVSVPEPGTLALFGIGLLGMGLARRRKKV